MDNQVSRLSVVMPCFNELEAIPAIIPRTLKELERLEKQRKIQDFELIIVDDNSTDGSLEKLQAFSGIRVIKSEGEGRGYGKALKSGFKAAQGDWIGFLDIDNTYRPEDLSLFVEAIRTGPCDFFMGQRGMNEKGMSFTRGFGNAFYVFLARFFYGSPLSDVCSGYRFFHRRHLQQITHIREQGLDFSIQLTLEMLTNKIPIHAIPIQYDERIGKSKLSIVSDGWSFLKVLLTSKLRQSRALKHSQV